MTRRGVMSYCGPVAAFRRALWQVRADRAKDWPALAVAPDRELILWARSPAVAAARARKRGRA